MTLEDAVKEFEAQFSVVDRTGCAAIAPNGAPFTVISICGPVSAGARYAMASSEDEAARMWLAAARAFAGDKAVLYWRAQPEIDRKFVRECKEDGSVIPIPEDLRTTMIREVFRVYSRMAVGDAQEKAA